MRTVKNPIDGTCLNGGTETSKVHGVGVHYCHLQYGLRLLILCNILVLAYLTLLTSMVVSILMKLFECKLFLRILQK